MGFRQISSYLPEQVPANKFLFAGIVLANKFLFAGTVPANNLFLFYMGYNIVTRGHKKAPKCQNIAVGPPPSE